MINCHWRVSRSLLEKVQENSVYKDSKESYFLKEK